MPWITIAELALLALLLVVIVPVVLLFARRRWLTGRHGGVDVAARLTGSHQFALGMGRYRDHELHWYRSLSLSLRPSLHLRQGEWSVEEHRTPDATEARGTYRDQVIVTLRHRKGHVLELAMSPTSMTGFMSWLESAAPGAAHYGHTAD